MDKKKIGIICGIVAAIILVVVIVIVATRKPAPEPAPETTTTTAPTTTAETTKAPEELSYSGILSEVGIYSLTVDGHDGEKAFDVTNATFEYKQEGILVIGDTVTVKYIVEDKNNIAKTVTVDAEVPIVCVAKGIVTDLHDNEVIVVSEQITTKYSKDKDTVVEGNLSVGDEVEVTFKYNHEENFHADKIKVTSENKDPREVVCIGNLNEVKDNAIVVGVNRKITFTFKLTGNTKIVGKASKLEKDQTVAVTFIGHPEDSPEALIVEVTAVPEPKPTPTPTPTPDPEPGPSVHATGIITEWGDKVVILTEKNKKVELKVSDSMEIPSGFFPAKGDMVHFEFGLKDLTMTKISFISRADTMTQGNIVSWKDGKVVITNIKAFKEGEVAKDGVDLKKKDLEANEVEFLISDDIDMLDGYMPQQGDCIKFRYMVRQDENYELVFVRYLGTPEEDPTEEPTAEPTSEQAN